MSDADLILCELLVLQFQRRDNSAASVLWSLLGVLACLFMWFVNLWNRLLTAERTMREYILRVEYRVAELTRDPR